MRKNSATPDLIATPLLPPGADPNLADEWEREQDGKSAYRMFWSKPYDTRLDVRVVAIQLPDGTVVDRDTTPEDAPLVYIASDDYTPDDARKLATAILAAADLADQWAIGKS